MSENAQIDAIRVLSRLKEVLSLKNDAQLAQALGIRQNVLSNWKARGAIDYERVLLLCKSKGINPEWVINGVGVRFSDGRFDEKGELRRIFYVRRNPEIQTSAGHHLEVCRDRFIDIDGEYKGGYIFEAFDDTMSPDIVRGDRVLFQFADKPDINDCIIKNRIVLFEHNVTMMHYFRRVTIRQSTGEIILCTNDPDFHVFRLSEGMIVGFVHEVIRVIL